MRFFGAGGAGGWALAGASGCTEWRGRADLDEGCEEEFGTGRFPRALLDSLPPTWRDAGGWLFIRRENASSGLGAANSEEESKAEAESESMAGGAAAGLSSSVRSTVGVEGSVAGGCNRDSLPNVSVATSSGGFPMPDRWCC